MTETGKRRSVCLAGLVLLAASPAHGTEPPKPYGAVPSAAQLKWHRQTQRYGLICFNMPTFTNEEWAYGGKPPCPGQTQYQQALSGHRNGKFWMPAEADVSIRPGWYYHESQNRRVRTAQDLIRLFFLTVGRGASLNLGLPPDRRGRLPDSDVKSLRGFGKWLRENFGTNLARDAKVTASNVRGKGRRFSADNVTDGKRDSYWCTEDAVLAASITMDLGKDTEFNVVSLREYLPLGQRVDGWALDRWDGGQWVELATGTAIGRRLWRGGPVVCSRVRLRITKAAAPPAISEFALHREGDRAGTAPI